MHLSLEDVDQVFRLHRSLMFFVNQRLKVIGKKVATPENTFEGNDEMDPSSGRGWAVREGDRIGGKIVFHQGDESKFRAEHTSG